jgi:hypothetical protein
MAMLSTDRPEQMVEDGVFTEDAESAYTKPACMALVPVVPSVQWSHPAHLQRAALADAQSAYSANRRHTMGAGVRTRQVI